MEDPEVRIGEEERAAVAEAERLVKEAEFGARELGGWSFWLSGAVALAMTAFQLWTAAVGTLPGVLQRSGSPDLRDHTVPPRRRARLEAGRLTRPARAAYGGGGRRLAPQSYR